MLNEIQLQKLVDKNFMFVHVSKDGDEYVLSKLTSDGWETVNVSSPEGICEEVNKYKFRPDVVLEVDNRISDMFY